MMMVAIMATVLSTNAQYKAGTFSLTPKVGINIASLTNVEKLPISGNVNLERQPLGGGLIGVETEYQLIDRLGLTAGGIILYSPAGGRGAICSFILFMTISIFPMISSLVKRIIFIPSSSSLLVRSSSDDCCSGSW